MRVVAGADSHGAYPEFVAILQRVGLIEGNRQWIGGSSVLVQTGDVIDRSKESRNCLDLLMDLERQAVKQNGRVIPLLGNHEVMNIMGDLRYVVPEDYRAFATEQSDKRREEAYRDYRDFLASHAAHHHAAVSDDEAGRQKWMADHPLGFFERHDAFDAQGPYGRWIRSRDTVTQVGDALFLHGGLNPAIHFKSIADLNERVHSEIARFDNHVFLIDTGMLKEVYGGRGSALEFRDGSVTAYYTDAGPQVLAEPGGRAASLASSLGQNDGKSKP
jgi:hypothetical protein